jgi:hypothetical protein
VYGALSPTTGIPYSSQSCWTSDCLFSAPGSGTGSGLRWTSIRKPRWGVASFLGPSPRRWTDGLPPSSCNAWASREEPGRQLLDGSGELLQTVAAQLAPGLCRGQAVVPVTFLEHLDNVFNTATLATLRRTPTAWPCRTTRYMAFCRAVQLLCSVTASNWRWNPPKPGSFRRLHVLLGLQLPLIKFWTPDVRPPLPPLSLVCPIVSLVYHY